MCIRECSFFSVGFERWEGVRIYRLAIIIIIIFFIHEKTVASWRGVQTRACNDWRCDMLLLVLDTACNAIWR